MSVNNVLKIMTYIYPISKQKIVCGKYEWQPVKSIYIRPSLFAYDECLVCGKCCISEDLVFLPFEVSDMREVLKTKNVDEIEHKLNGKGYDNIEELLASLSPFEVEVNGKSYILFKSKLPAKIYEFEDRGTLQRCHFNLPTEDGRLGCGIHPVSSLTCKMPHIGFYHNSKSLSTSIGHGEYGRNWAMKCPADIKKEGFNINSLKTAIANFELLAKYCKYFKIETYVSEILNCLYKVQNNAGYINSVCDTNLIGQVKRRRLF